MSECYTKLVKISICKEAEFFYDGKKFVRRSVERSKSF